MKYKQRPHIIAYDIADKKRLQKVHRLVREHAIPLQRSVFLASMTPYQCDKLMKALKN